MRSHSFLRVFVMLVGMSVFISIFPTLTFASSDFGPSELTSAKQAAMHSMNNLEVAYQQWHIYRPAGRNSLGFGNGSVLPVKAPVRNIPAIQLAINSSSNYYNLHAYRDLPAQNKAQYFRMTVSFYITHSNPAQAIEFHMNKWVGTTRWKFGIQWETTLDGSSRQGKANSWRVWDGKGWQNTSVAENLSVNTWHTLHLVGEIFNGKVHYLSFDCDATKVSLNSFWFSPIHETKGDKLAVAVQLDGAPHLPTYPLDVDGINLQWL